MATSTREESLFCHISVVSIPEAQDNGHSKFKRDGDPVEHGLEVFLDPWAIH